MKFLQLPVSRILKHTHFLSSDHLSFFIFQYVCLLLVKVSMFRLSSTWSKSCILGYILKLTKLQFLKFACVCVCVGAYTLHPQACIYTHICTQSHRCKLIHMRVCTHICHIQGATNHRKDPKPIPSCRKICRVLTRLYLYQV